MSEALDNALRFARHGFRLIKVKSNSKIPDMGKDWVGNATNDEATIQRWFDSDQHTNYGIAGSIATQDGEKYLLRVDADIKPGVDGRKAVEELGLPPTLTVRTPSGGLHYYFTTDIEYSNGWRGKGPKAVDVRGYGGFTVGPGCMVNGNGYEIIEGSIDVVAPAPAKLLHMITPKRAKSEVRIAHESTSIATQCAALDVLRKSPVAMEGERDNTAFQVAAKLNDIGLPDDKILDLLSSWSIERCNPPLPHEDLARIVDSVSRNALRPKGERNPEYAYGAAGINIDDIWFKYEPEEITPVPYVIDEIFPESDVTVIYGVPGSNKSAFVHTLAMHVSTGTPVNHLGRKLAVKEGPVLLIAGEGRAAITARLTGVMKGMGISDPGRIAVPTLSLDISTAESLLTLRTMIIDIIKVAGSISLVILDTFATVYHGDENDNAIAGLTITELSRLAQDFSCAIVIVHHANKSGAMRGASSLLGNSNTVIAVKNTGKEIKDVVFEKTKDIAAPDDFRIRRNYIQWTNKYGDEIKSIYVTSMSGALPFTKADALKIVEEIKLSGPITPLQLARKLDMKKRDVAIVLQALAELKLVEKAGHRYKYIGQDEAVDLNDILDEITYGDVTAYDDEDTEQP